ncbi:hypothetical protein [Arthrobacter sp.]|uniref:hypothetical protein n=1 Tax=Arthrobacter sp. TaxID=1667 RepID=UPI003A8CAD6F
MDHQQQPQDHQPGTESTGDAAVDAQLEALDALDQLPVSEHQDVYAALHAGLRQVLDEEPTDA